MNKIEIIFNPNCSKCRIALDKIESNNIPHTIINYLENELSLDQLRNILTKSGKRPKDLLRYKEKTISELNLDFENDEQILQAIIDHPIILERPLIINGSRITIARSEEALIDSLDNRN